MISINSLSKSFRGLSGRRVAALTDLSLEVQEGEVFGFLGPNGAGKSTTIKLLLNLIRADQGHATIAGENVSDPKVRRLVGFLPENPYFYDYLTADELLHFGGKVSGMTSAEIQDRSDYLLNKVLLSDVRRRQLRTYSKGMVQRAGLALSLIHDPKVVILDEPMSGLDPLGRQMVFDLMMNLRSRGKTILFCSHVLSDVERLCDEVIIMHGGEVRRHLSREDIFLAQKGVEILVEHSSHNEQALKTADYQIKIFPEHLCLYVEAHKLNNALQLLHSKSITIVNVQSSAVTLESIFYDVVASP